MEMSHASSLADRAAARALVLLRPRARSSAAGRSFSSHSVARKTARWGALPPFINWTTCMGINRAELSS